MTTPLGKADFMLGYALAFGLMAVLQAVITVAFAVYVCGLTVDGPIWQLGLVAVVDALLGTSLGLLASAFAQTEFQAVQFMPLLVFPQIILGGLFMPRDQMPDVLHAISDWLPLSHAIDAIHAVTAGDDGLGRVRPGAHRRRVRGGVPDPRFADAAPRARPRLVATRRAVLRVPGRRGLPRDPPATDASGSARASRRAPARRDPTRTTRDRR